MAGLRLLGEALEQAITQVVSQVTTDLDRVLGTLPPYRDMTVSGLGGAGWPAERATYGSLGTQ